MKGNHRMPHSLRLSHLASIAALLPSPSHSPPALHAQPRTLPPAASPAAAAPPRPPPRAHRPGVLPRLTGDQVVHIMHHFEYQLGVDRWLPPRGDTAHKPGVGHLDFPSDDNPMKDRARVMMRMNEEINRLPHPARHPAPRPASMCGTCHRATPSLHLRPRPLLHHPSPQASNLHPHPRSSPGRQGTGVLPYVRASSS